MNALPRLALVIATGGGIGLLPRAPGTWASLLAALMAPALFLPLALPARLGLLAVVYAGGAWSAARAAALWGRPDPPQVVVDEIVGQWLTLLLSPPTAQWREIALALLLFRALDIAKPWPIGLVDRRVSGGHGIMLDDVLAGLIALGSLSGLRLLLP